MGKSTIKQTVNESSSSYCKMLDGTLIQWGRRTVTSYSAAIAFPVEFIDTNYSLIATHKSASGEAKAYAAAVGTTTTGYIYAASGSADAYWIAIGRWKV